MKIDTFGRHSWMSGYNGTMALEIKIKDIAAFYAQAGRCKLDN